MNSNIKVMILDDNKEFVKLLETYVNTQDDMEVIVTDYDGKNAVELVKTFKPDVLLIDIIMPEKDGLVVLEELSKKWYYSSHKIMYIGRANYDNDNPQSQKNRATLQNRVKAYMRFGNNEKIGHWGGRYIWQLADSGELDVWYKVCDNPQTIESELIKKHKPFANLKKGDKD